MSRGHEAAARHGNSSHRAVPSVHHIRTRWERPAPKDGEEKRAGFAIDSEFTFQSQPVAVFRIWRIRAARLSRLFQSSAMAGSERLGIGFAFGADVAVKPPFPVIDAKGRM